MGIERASTSRGWQKESETLEYVLIPEQIESVHEDSEVIIQQSDEQERSSVCSYSLEQIEPLPSDVKADTSKKEEKQSKKNTKESKSVCKRSAKTSKEQYECYLDFIQENKIQNLEHIHNLWSKLSTKLNNESGPKKDEKEWKKIFSDWTNMVKRKARKIFVHQHMTGGGLPAKEEISDLEEKLLSVIGMIIVEGIKVRELGFPSQTEEMDGTEKVSSIKSTTKRQGTSKEKNIIK